MQTESTTGLIEPTSWRQTTVPDFPSNGNFKKTHDPRRDQSLLSNIRRDFDEKHIDLASEASYRQVRPPSPPPPPFSSPVEDIPHVRRLFERTDRPKIVGDVFERTEVSPVEAAFQRQSPTPPPSHPPPPPPNEYRLDGR